MRGSCKFSCSHTTPLQVCGSSGRTAITPAFITPPNTPCGCSDVLSYPLFITPYLLSHPQTHLVLTSYHTPWFITPPLGPLRAALYHSGHTRYHTPHRAPHPVIIFLNPKMLLPACVILCQSRYIILLGWGGAMEREPISDFSQRTWGFHTAKGGDDPR